MARLLAILGSAMLVAAPVQAQTSEWPEGSANATGEIYKGQYDAAAKVLQRRDRQLLDLLTQADPGRDDPRLLQAVKAQQRAWRSYVEAECDLIGALDIGFSPMQSAKAVQCQANLTQQRVRRVTAAIKCVERIPADRRMTDEQACLYQLAPVAVPLK